MEELQSFFSKRFKSKITSLELDVLPGSLKRNELKESITPPKNSLQLNVFFLLNSLSHISSISQETKKKFHVKAGIFGGKIDSAIWNPMIPLKFYSPSHLQND